MFNNMTKSDRIFIGVLILIFCLIATSFGISFLRFGAPVFKLLGIAFMISGIYGAYKVVTSLVLNKNNEKGKSE